MKIGSLFDGSGGFPLAFSICGFEPVWAAEVEPYPIAVTRSRFPNMKHHGNVSLVDGAEIEPVDVITFGAPCQDMSIAGKRAGMKHEDRGDDETTRSGLFFEAIRITNEMRVATRGKYPRFIIWENVPGAFSSNKGGDFQSVLEAFCSIGGDSVSVPMPEKDKWSYSGEIVGDGYSVAWRTHDAQYWGVPQRRRRIYVVADLNGECAREVLFKPESVRGYFAQGDDAGKEVAPDVVGCADRSVGVECLGFEPGAESRVGSHAWEERAGTLRAEMGDNQAAVVYSFDSLSSNSMKSKNPYSGCREVDYSKTIDTSYPDPSKNQGGIAIVQEVNCLGTDGNTARCLTRRYDSSPCEDRGQNIVSYSAAFMGGQGSKAGGIGYSEKVSPTLKSVLSGGNTIPDVVIKTLVFDTTQITSPQNGSNPQWNDPCHPLTAQGNPPTVIALQGNGIGRGDNAGCDGAGWREDQSYTLNTVDRHAVVYPDVVGTLAASGAGTSRTAGQGNETDLVIVEENNHPFIASGKPYVGTLQANCSTKLWLGNQEAFSGDYAVLTPAKPPRKYIIRRLHPIECARLQGFPDWWGDLAEYDGDAAFWEEVRKTIAAIEGKSYKPSKNLEKWYYGLHTDAAEYKMWGNGIALPFAIYVANNIKTITNS